MLSFWHFYDNTTAKNTETKIKIILFLAFVQWKSGFSYDYCMYLFMFVCKFSCCGYFDSMVQFLIHSLCIQSENVRCLFS